jgi:ferredoxin
MHKILECAATDEEARFILDLPAANADLAAKYGLEEHAVEQKILSLARRGLLVSSREGMRFPFDPATLHDCILSSTPDLIPPEMDRFWMELYDGEDWGTEIGTVLAGLPMPVLRAIPIQNTVPPKTTLLPHESVVDIIQAHKDLITIRNCCCRVGAKKCDHPTQVCMQFAERAEYDLYRSSGRKVSADEATVIAAQAGNSGLVPTVGNTAQLDGLDFICFCCGCCCLVINPGRRVGQVQNILAPSRFLGTVDPEACDGCKKCVERCAVDAIVAGEAAETVVVDRNKCLGCGACVLACPIEGALTMEPVRPPEFIPQTNFMTSILHA